ncbi:sugar ABC transporter substrate-binding protein, partial [Clavibacter californiensis]
MPQQSSSAFGNGLTRRSLLSAGVGAAAVGLLAACSGGGGGASGAA